MPALSLWQELVRLWKFPRTLFEGPTLSQYDPSLIKSSRKDKLQTQQINVIWQDQEGVFSAMTPIFWNITSPEARLAGSLLAFWTGQLCHLAWASGNIVWSPQSIAKKMAIYCKGEYIFPNIIVLIVFIAYNALMIVVVVFWGILLYIWGFKILYAAQNHICETNGYINLPNK